MANKKEQILSTVKEVLHSIPDEVDGITTQEWVEILKTKGVKTTPGTFIKHLKNFIHEEYEKNTIGYYVPERPGHYVLGDAGHLSSGNKETNAPIKYYWFFT